MMASPKQNPKYATGAHSVWGLLKCCDLQELRLYRATSTIPILAGMVSVVFYGGNRSQLSIFIVCITELPDQAAVVV